MAEATVAKQAIKIVKEKKGPSLREHLRGQNVFFYLSAFASLLLIVLLFFPWIQADPSAKRESASLLGVILQCTRNVDLLIFMIPTALIFIGIHVTYLVSLLRPGHDPIYSGTVSILLSGLTIFFLVFASDSAFQVVSLATEEQLSGWSGFLVLTGASIWTPVPVIWFLLALVQKWFLVKFAHPKEVIAYPDGK